MSNSPSVNLKLIQFLWSEHHDLMGNHEEIKGGITLPWIIQKSDILSKKLLSASGSNKYINRAQSRFNQVERSPEFILK